MSAQAENQYCKTHGNAIRFKEGVNGFVCGKGCVFKKNDDGTFTPIYEGDF